MKNKLKKILGILLSLSIIGNTVDMTALTVHADEITGKTACITAFDELDSAVQNQSLPVGVAETDIQFPDTLSVTIEKTVTSKKTVPEETLPGSVSGNDVPIEGLSVSSGDLLPVENTTPTVEIVEETVTTQVVENIQALGWILDVARSTSGSFSATEESCGAIYTYVPQLQLTDSEGTVLTIAEGVKLPAITVTVGPAIESASMGKYTVNYYMEAESPDVPGAVLMQNKYYPSESKYFVLIDSYVGYYEVGVVLTVCLNGTFGKQEMSIVEYENSWNEIPETLRNYDYAQITSLYGETTGTITDRSTGTVTEDGTLTFNLCWILRDNYTEKHYVKAADGDVTVDGERYKLAKTNTLEITTENKGTTVTISDLTATAEYAGYRIINPQPSGAVTSGIVNKDLTLVQFYEEIPKASYIERYYIEDETATENYIKMQVGGVLKTYRLHHENIVDGAQVGSVVSIADLSGESAFSGYTLVTEHLNGYPSTSTVAEGNTTIMYQFYDKKPPCNYSVVYYVEVYEEQRDGSNITVNVNGEDKYYNRITDSAYNMSCQAPEGTLITVADSSSDVPGVYAGGVAVSDTFKDYSSTLRKYSYDATVAYGKHTGTVAADGSLQIVLFYDWIDATPTSAKYTEKYYAELADQNVAYGYELIDGVKYEVLGTYEKTGTIGEEVEIEDISTREPYKTDYELMAATAMHPSRATVADDHSTIVYQIYRLHPQYMISYYKETDNGTVTVGDKKYSMAHYDFNRMPRGTTISYLKLADGAAAAAVGGIAINGTTQSYDGYEFSENATQQRGKGSFTVTRGADNSIELFFDKIVPTTTYTEEYYVELEDRSATTYDKEVAGVKYQLKESNTCTIDKNLGARITDKSTDYLYAEYELQPATTTYPSEVADVADDGGTVLYQFYRLQPKYTVRYYKEAAAGAEGAVPVGEKYYVLVETMLGEARSNSVIECSERIDGTVGVTVNSVENAVSFKAFANYIFNADATALNNKVAVTITRDAENVVELFFDKARTASYRCEYYVEIEDKTTTDFDKKIGGVKYELKDCHIVEGVAYDASVDIPDKSAEYGALGYDLMPDTAEYPSRSFGVNADGSTVLYQIYRLRPRYTVRYYTEVDEEITQSVTVGGKYYILQENDTIVKTPAEGTVITYAELHDGAGVAEDGGAVTETVRSYDGYVFSSIASRLNGNVSGTVTRDDRVVIELFFDRVRVDYTEVYWVENPDAVTDYLEVKVDGAVRKFVIGKTYTVEGAWINEKVAVRDRDDEFVAYRAIYDDVTNYSAVSYGLNADGSTRVHRFYVLKQEPEQTTTPDAVLPDNNPTTPKEPVRKKAPKTGDKGNWRNALLSICAAYIATLLWKRRNQ